MSTVYRGPSIDASYQVSLHLDKWFQRRRFLKIGQSETNIACGGHVYERIGTKSAIFIEDLPKMLPPMLQYIWPRGLKEKIKMWKVNGWQTWWQKLTLPKAMRAKMINTADYGNNLTCCHLRFGIVCQFNNNVTI